MYFLDWIHVTCPHCHQDFQRRANWLRQAGRLCPHCRGSLDAPLLDLELQSQEWDAFIDDIDRLIAMRREFDVPFDERDALEMLTFGDAQRLVIDRLAAAGRSDHDPASVWERLVTAITRVPDYKPSATRRPADRFMRSPLLLSDPTSTGGSHP